MALATCDSIRVTGRINVRDMRERFLRWYRKDAYSVSGLFDIGGTTANALSSGRRPVVPRQRLELRQVRARGREPWVDTDTAAAVADGLADIAASCCPQSSDGKLTHELLSNRCHIVRRIVFIVR
jgi:ADP-ribosylglycohydrolase